MLKSMDDGETDGSGPLFDEDRTLLLDALERQASSGPCVGARPWGFWDPRGALEWEAWSMLGKISADKAMELYCEVIEMRYPDWFNILVRGMSEKQKRALIATAKECALDYYRALASGELGDTAKATTSKQARQVLAFDSAASPTAFLDEIFVSAADDEFAKLPVLDDKSPRARSGHVAAMVHGDTLFVSHGRSANSRLLGDLWGLDLSTGTWSARSLRWPGSPCAGMASALIDSKLFCFRGKSAADCDASAVYVLNVSAIELSADFSSSDSQFKWTHVRATNEGEALPRARLAHTATVVGDSVLIFGGVDSASGDDMAECWAFNPRNASWRRLADGTRARSSHTATALDDRYLIVCGGSEANELCDCSMVDVFDAQSNEWCTIQCASNVEAPSPRAGHAAVVVGTRWYIIGGGDNERALQDAYCVDLRGCVDERRTAHWSVFARDNPLIGREGMSASAVMNAATGRAYILLHGGSNFAASALNDTLACRLSTVHA